MTDPRIATLAEALHDWYAGKDAEFDGAQCRHREDAAAILAALPPDWCGHDGPLGPYYRKEIARLRRIEEAARALLDNHPLRCERADALRAALESR